MIRLSHRACERAASVSEQNLAARSWLQNVTKNNIVAAKFLVTVRENKAGLTNWYFEARNRLCRTSRGVDF